MRISVVYHSVTGNTRAQAELVAEGAKSISGADVRLMPIENIDEAWMESSAAVIFGSPTYEGCMSWQMKQFLDTTTVKLNGKLAGFFATQNWPGGGGADLTELTMIAATLIHGMLVYSGGFTNGMPPTHFGAVSHRAPSTDFDRDRATKIGSTIAAKAMELFGNTN